MRALDIDSTRIIKLYDEGSSLRKIAKIFECSVTAILRILKKENISRRKKSSFRKYHFQEDVFLKIDDTDKAYWLGFIFADGCESENEYRLTIAINGLEHLEKFQYFLNTDYPIKPVSEKAYRIQMNSKRNIDCLEKLGLHPRKARTILYSSINPIFNSDFIRGYFDGDGHCSFTKEEKLIFSIASGSFSFLEKIQIILMKKCDLNKTKISYGDGTYILRYSGNRQVPRILEYLYKNAMVYLDRKFNFCNNFIKNNDVELIRSD